MPWPSLPSPYRKQQKTAAHNRKQQGIDLRSESTVTSIRKQASEVTQTTPTCPSFQPIFFSS
jgi:hypothetical protein